MAVLVYWGRGACEATPEAVRGHRKCSIYSLEPLPEHDDDVPQTSVQNFQNLSGRNESG